MELRFGLAPGSTDAGNGSHRCLILQGTERKRQRAFPSLERLLSKDFLQDTNCPLQQDIVTSNPISEVSAARNRNLCI